MYKDVSVPTTESTCPWTWRGGGLDTLPPDLVGMVPKSKGTDLVFPSCLNPDPTPDKPASLRPDTLARQSKPDPVNRFTFP